LPFYVLAKFLLAKYMANIVKILNVPHFFRSKARWQKNGSFGFLSVGLCVGKKQMCHFRVGFLH